MSRAKRFAQHATALFAILVIIALFLYAWHIITPQSWRFLPHEVVDNFGEFLVPWLVIYIPAIFIVLK